MRARAAGLALLLASACTGTETGNPSFEGELSYNTLTGDAARVTLAALALEGDAGGVGAPVVVDSAWLVLGDARFIRDDLCERREDIEPHASGLGAGDHATAAAARSGFMLEIGSYCGLELPLRRAGAGELPDGAPDELEGHSVVIEGTLESGAGFRVESALETQLFLGARTDPFAMNPDQARVLVGFDVAAWLAQLDLSSPSADGDLVVLSQTRNPELLAEFEARFAAGVALYRDPDGSGQVSSDATPIARAQ